MRRGGGSRPTRAAITSRPAPARAGSRTTRSGRPRRRDHGRRHAGPQHLDPVEAGGIPPEIGHGRPAPLDRDHRCRPVRRHAGQRHREQPRTGIEVGDPLARPGRQALQYHAGEGGRGLRVHLPEDAGTDLEVVAVHVEGHVVGRLAGCAPSTPGRRRGRAARRSGACPCRRGPPASPRPGEARTSSWRAPFHDTDGTRASFTPSVAMGHRSTGTRSWLRWRWRPTVPSASTAKPTRVRHPSPSGAPGTSSTGTRRSRPARRDSCSATRSSLRRRWAGRATCWKSHPPHRPGPAWGQARSTRSGDASSTSTASARRNDEASDVIRARTRSPGRLWRTKTTRPSGARAHASAAGGDRPHLELEHVGGSRGA